MALGVAAYFLFSGHDAAIKWLVTGAPGEPPLLVWQVLFARSVFIVDGGADRRPRPGDGTGDR